MIICSPQMGLDPSSTFGGEVYDHNLLRRMAELGHEIQVPLPSWRAMPEIAGIKAHPVRFHKGRYSNLAFALAADRLYAERGFDLLRVHSPRYVGPAGMAFRYRHPDVPVVAHHHHLDPGRINRWSLSLVFRYADAIITGSEFSRGQILREVGGNEAARGGGGAASEGRGGAASEGGRKGGSASVNVVYYGIDEAYRPVTTIPLLRRRTGLDGRKILLSMGGLILRKNQVVLLDCLRRMLLRGPECQLVFLGDGEMRPRLEAVARQMGIASSVLFLGRVTQEEKLGWLRACDVVVSTSSLEGFGFAVAEGMACGKPAVAMDAGSLFEIIEPGVTGHLVPQGDVGGFTEAVMGILSHPERQAQMGEAGARRVDRLFRWERAVRQTMAVYEEVLARKRALCSTGKAAGQAVGKAAAEAAAEVVGKAAEEEASRQVGA